MATTINDKVKLALRISHNLLDGEITDVIASGRQEMERAGVSAEIANSSLEIVETALKTYALALSYYSEPTTAEKYMESFKYQLDNIRKSTLEVPSNDDV